MLQLFLKSVTTSRVEGVVRFGASGDLLPSRTSCCCWHS
jgi:hypothetical protein